MSEKYFNLKTNKMEEINIPTKSQGDETFFSDTSENPLLTSFHHPDNHNQESVSSFKNKSPLFLHTHSPDSNSNLEIPQISTETPQNREILDKKSNSNLWRIIKGLLAVFGVILIVSTATFLYLITKYNVHVSLKPLT